MVILEASVVSTNALNRVIVVSAPKNSYTTANLQKSGQRFVMRSVNANWLEVRSTRSEGMRLRQWQSERCFSLRKLLRFLDVWVSASIEGVVRLLVYPLVYPLVRPLVHPSVRPSV